MMKATVQTLESLTRLPYYEDRAIVVVAEVPAEDAQMLWLILCIMVMMMDNTPFVGQFFDWPTCCSRIPLEFPSDHRRCNFP